MRSFIKRAGAIMAAAALIVTSGLFSMQVKAATAPSSVNISLSATTVNAGDSITIWTAYAGDTATSIKYEFYSPYFQVPLTRRHTPACS